jgi:geranylgeranylglycerol-phosphate geranylgeranyltransferase
MNKLQRQIDAMLDLIRPPNLIITALTVWVGGMLAGGREYLLDSTLFMAAFAAALVAAGGNAINDAYDEDIDLINRPHRPIPSGRLDYINAFKLGGGLLILGVGFSFYLMPSLGMIALTIAALLWMYSLWLKRTVLLGNFAISFCGAMAFIYGAAAVENPTGGMYPAGFAFLIHLGREIIKDVEDVAGDRLCGAMTLPVVMGNRSALKGAAIVLAILIIATFIPYWTEKYSFKYLELVVLLVDLPLVLIILFLRKGLESKGLRRVSLALKLIMVAGLVALYVG